MTDCDLVIRNATLLTADDQDRVIRNGTLAVSAGLILDVGEPDSAAAALTGTNEIDAEGAVVHPGFIDPHIHISQYSARSVLPRMAGSSVTMGHWKAELKPEDEVASARVAIADYLTAGYTGFADPGTVFAPEAVAPLAEETGIRIWLADPYIADRGDELVEKLPELACDPFIARWPHSTQEALGRLGKGLSQWSGDNLLRAHLGIYGDTTASEELMRAAAAMAREKGVKLHLHMGYTPEGYLAEEKRLGRRMLDVLAERDCLGPHVTFTHMNLVRQDEVDRLSDAGAGLIWAPWGTLQAIGRGQAEPRMVELLRAGVSVGVATDIPRQTALDGLGTLTSAAAAASGEELLSGEVLRLRTAGAAQTLGEGERLGVLAPGYAADFVIRRSHDGPGADSLHETAVLGSSAGVDRVFIAGRPVVADGKLLTVDAEAAAVAAGDSVAELLKRIGLETG